jgi:hypothetical protein
MWAVPGINGECDHRLFHFKENKLLLTTIRNQIITIERRLG